MIRDIASLMAPHDADLFYDHFIQKARLHLKCTEHGRAMELLPWSVINEIIDTEALSPDRLKLFRAGNVVPPAMYRTDDEKNRLRAGAVQNLLGQGSSLVINGIHDLVPAIGRLTAAIERELSCWVECNAYLTFGVGSAFKAHYDLHDVLIVQVHGRKRWRSYGDPLPHPIEQGRSTGSKQRDVVWEGILEAGDILYLPRGEIHVAELEGTYSVHLTIGIMALRGLDFVKALLKQAAENVVFRQDLPIAAGRSAIGRHEATLKAALHALIDAADLDRYSTGVTGNAGCVCWSILEFPLHSRLMRS
jgi:ribosomal protein L16 Arg81 hydroxylase